MIGIMGTAEVKYKYVKITGCSQDSYWYRDFVGLKYPVKKETVVFGDGDERWAVAGATNFICVRDSKVVTG